MSESDKTTLWIPPLRVFTSEDSLPDQTTKNLHFDSLNTIWIGNTTNEQKEPKDLNNSPNRLDLRYFTDCNGTLTITLTYKKDGLGVSRVPVQFDYLGNLKDTITNENGLAVVEYPFQSIDDIEVFVNDKVLTIQVDKPNIECLKYPIKNIRGEIIEGNGVIVNRIEKNSSRNYKIESENGVRLVDYTFYFPGWKAYVDGQEVPIEFQDVNYRGVITYKVPSGNHTVDVVLKPTKTRLAGYFLSLLSFVFIITYIIYARKRPQLPL